MRLKPLFLLLLVVVLGTGAGAAWWWQQPIDLAATPAEFRIANGSSAKSAAQQMRGAGVNVSPTLFAWAARALGRAGQIKAGSYEVGQGITPATLLEKLTRGDVSQSSLTIVEGWTFRQIRAALASNTELEHDTQGLSDEEVLAQLGSENKAAEGLFMPDTYLFDKHSKESDVLRRAYMAMQKQLDLAWAGRDEKLPIRTPYEALILASLVEKESGVASDRAMIASVFANRLRKGMLLQTDPSVIYGLGERFDGNLRKRDLLADTPYNTYTRVGLPPTPIAAPGRDALAAALNPPSSNYLYFVARGDGSSEFSSDLAAHNRAVARFQKR